MGGVDVSEKRLMFMHLALYSPPIGKNMCASIQRLGPQMPFTVMGTSRRR